MEIRVGTYMRSTKNVIADVPMPLGFKLVVFGTKDGNAIGYVFGPGKAPEGVMDAAESIAENMLL